MTRVTAPAPPTGAAEERPLTVLYAAVILTEAVAVVLLWALGRWFG